MGVITSLARSSGVLLHPTSLPGGRFGSDAYAFIDWLAAAGQSWWQILPLGPPDGFGSPYMPSSAFACWRGLLADPDAAVSDAEITDFRERHAFWAREWEAFAGADALRDQVRFEREWAALRAYAASRGVRVIGDLPLYIAADSADHRFHPELFREGVVAGAPPDPLSATGQLWGHPLYDWPAHQRRGYRWWIERFRRSCELVDVLRIDHFRGFVSYWAVPAGDLDAAGGRWQRGPGEAPFRAASRSLGPLPLIVEDLGVISPAVRRLRERLGYPGMAVLQFAFDAVPDLSHRPENITEEFVVYTATHDMDTTRGWWAALDPATQARSGLDPSEPHWSLIEIALGCRARVALVPAQDVLGLGSDARMNLPGKTEGNWRWQLAPGALTPALGRRLRSLTEASGRLRS